MSESNSFGGMPKSPIHCSANIQTAKQSGYELLVYNLCHQMLIVSKCSFWSAAAWRPKKSSLPKGNGYCANVCYRLQVTNKTMAKAPGKQLLSPLQAKFHGKEPKSLAKRRSNVKRVRTRVNIRMLILAFQSCRQLLA